MTTHHRVALLHLKCLALTTYTDTAKYRSLPSMEGALLMVEKSFNADCRYLAWRGYEIMEAMLMQRIANTRIDPLDLRITTGGNNEISDPR